MKFNWKKLLILLLGAAVEIIPTVLEERSKDALLSGDKPDPGRSTSLPTNTNRVDGVSHPLQNLRRRATD